LPAQITAKGVNSHAVAVYVKFSSSSSSTGLAHTLLVK